MHIVETKIRVGPEKDKLAVYVRPVWQKDKKMIYFDSFSLDADSFFQKRMLNFTSPKMAFWF